jgi:cellulose synthase operon protein C
MRLNYLFAILLIAVGVGLSLMLVPRSKELALQTFRDHEYEAAQKAYLQRYAAGERSAETVMPLVGLSLNDGDVAAAITYLESYVDREPTQLESRELLGNLYKADERMGDYLANLEELVRQRPTYDRVFELASYYRFFGRFQKLEGALRKMLAVRPDDGDTALELAELLAARGARDDALAVLTALDNQDAGRKTGVPARALMIALLVEKGEVETAFARADRWLDDKSPAFEILELVNLLVAANRPDLAYRLIKSYEARAAKEEALALAMVDLETVLGRLDEARLRLSAWAARARIPDASIGRFISLASNAGLSQSALDAVRDRDLRLVPDWALVGLADTAFRNNERAFLDRMVVELGESFLAERPVLAAEIALARDDKPGARRWAMATLADNSATVTDRLTAVRQLTRVGDTTAAVVAFDRLPLSGSLPDDVLTDLGSLFIELERPEVGFRWFADRRRNRPSVAADIGWARLCARAGEPEQVIAWLDRTPQVEGWILQDIAAVANERGSAALALKAAERAYALSQTPEVATLLAGAYLVDGRAGEALALIRPLLQWGGPAAEYVYAQALEALGLFEELAGYWTAKLATGLLNEKDADNALFAMVANKSYAAALPYLKERAESRAGEWLYAYIEAARGVGGEAPAVAATVLDRLIDSPDINDDEREQRVFLLLDLSREAAVAPLDRLVGRSPQRWWALAADNLRELRRKDDLATMLERLIADEETGRADRESMAYALIDAAGAERALPVIARLADEIGGAWDAIYRENLIKLGRRDELRRYLIARAERPDLSAEDRRALAFGLLEMDDKPAAEGVLRKLADGQGPDGPDMRQLYFLWGPRPGDAELDWMERRARQAGGAAKAAWYAKIVEMGGKNRVLAALGDDVPADTALLRPYIEAKIAVKDDDAAAKAIKQAAKSETAPENLRRYARQAEQIRRNDAAAAAWSALLARRPDDRDALRQLGMLAYDDLRYADAERLLRRYVLNKPDDYEAYYFLGEALVLLKRAGEATPFYRTALAQLRGKSKLPDQAMQTEAGLLNRLGKVEEAIAVYEKLRRLRPADRQIQADYANMLIENRRWTEARHVLAVY